MYTNLCVCGLPHRECVCVPVQLDSDLAYDLNRKAMGDPRPDDVDYPEDFWDDGDEDYFDEPGDGDY